MAEPNGTPTGRVNPSVTPMTFSVFTTPSNDLIAAEFHHAAGTFVMFLDPSAARNVAAELERAAGAVGSGLTVVQRPAIEPQVRGRG